MVVLVMIVLGLAFAVLSLPGSSMLNGPSLAALGIVVALTVIGGIVFSWARYFPRR